MILSKRRVLLAAPAALLLPATARAQDTLVGPDSPVWQAIAACNARFLAVVRSGEAAELAEQYAERANLYDFDGLWVPGREAILGHWRTTLPALRRGRFEMRTIRVTVQGTAALELSHVEVTPENAGASRHYRHSILWQEVGGAWLRTLENWKPPPPSLAVPGY